VLHEHFKPGSIDNDIAIIRLPTELTYDGLGRVLPVCLPRAALAPNANPTCLVTGWGETRGKQSRASMFSESVLLLKRNSSP